jgi:phosphoglycerate-specific signal transduction histidine kinase
MTHFLSSDTNPNGYRLEDVLNALRRDIIVRSVKIADDHRHEARQVLDNNVQILQLLTQAIHLAEKSTYVLDKSFGPSQSLHGGPPRIGVA